MKLNRLLLAAALMACAPEPTEPSDTSLAGTWTADAHLYALSNFRMQITQESEGIVSGTWSATRDSGAQAVGDLIGRNTVSQVEIELLGAGKFEGALVQPTRLRGIFAVGEKYDIITFNRQ